MLFVTWLGSLRHRTCRGCFRQSSHAVQGSPARSVPGSFQHFDLDWIVTSESEFRALIPPTGAVTHGAVSELPGYWWARRREGAGGRRSHTSCSGAR